MADDKLLKIGSSGLIEEFLPIDQSAGAGDAGKAVRLRPDGRFDLSVMPAGITANVVTCASFENLAAGDFVNLFLDAGVLKARRADASNGRRADGYVLTGVTAPATATVYTDDTITGLAGLTIAGETWLSNSTPGGVTQTAVTTAGHLLQRLGKALSATSITVEIGDPITRA